MGNIGPPACYTQYGVQVRTSIPATGGQAMRRAVVVSVIVMLSGALLMLTGCEDEPVVVSREALGTVVTVTAYGEDEAAVTAAVEGAYAAMTGSLASMRTMFSSTCSGLCGSVWPS